MYIYIFLFITGSMFASFINAYVSRTLKGESIIAPRSHCTNCNHTLAWYELIPVLSYIIQGGKCRKCKSKIGIDSLITEIILGLLYVLVYLVYGYSYESLLGFVIATMMLAIFISDFKELVILDSTLIFACLFTYGIIFMELGLRGIYKSFLYGVFAFVLMFLIKIFGDLIFKRESLGGGDIKLAFIMGSILPYNLFLVSLTVGSMCALPYAIIVTFKRQNRELAFGPFLVLGLFIVFLFKTEILNIMNMLIYNGGLTL